jgi:hypothetical protein
MNPSGGFVLAGLVAVPARTGWAAAEPDQTVRRASLTSF